MHAHRYHNDDCYCLNNGVGHHDVSGRCYDCEIGYVSGRGYDCEIGYGVVHAHHYHDDYCYCSNNDRCCLNNDCFCAIRNWGYMSDYAFLGEYLSKKID